MKIIISITTLSMVLILLTDHADSDVCVESRIKKVRPLFTPHRLHRKRSRYRSGSPFRSKPAHKVDSALPFRGYFAGFEKMDIKSIIECGTDNNITLPLLFRDKQNCNTCEEISLRIKHLNGSFVPEEAFTNFKEITHLHLENLGIKYISEGAFDDLDNCTQIHLTGNKICCSSVSLFNGLKKLTKVDLSYNAFNDLNCLLLNTSKDHNMFLNLSHNQIDFISGPVFDEKIPNVSSLDLSFNNIININFDDIPSRITELDLSHNRLLRTSGCIYKISKLLLSHNNIKYLQHECLKKIQKMHYLDISHNQISTLNFQTFPDNFDITIVLMQHNLISNISSGTFSNLIKLETLNLSHNRIYFLPIGSFENLGNLKILDLSNNLLEKLNLNIFSSMKSLKEFYIHDNAITDFHYKKMLDTFPELQSININSNNLSCDYIMDLLLHLQSTSVNFVHGTTKYSENIHGISCYSKLITESTTENKIESKKSIQAVFVQRARSSHQQITIFWLAMVVMNVLLLILAFQTYYIHYKCHLRKLDNVEMV